MTIAFTDLVGFTVPTQQAGMGGVAAFALETSEEQRARWISLSPGALRAEACFAELRLTAELDAITAGLFRDALSREEAACALDSEEKR